MLVRMRPLAMFSAEKKSSISSQLNFRDLCDSSRIRVVFPPPLDVVVVGVSMIVSIRPLVVVVSVLSSRSSTDSEERANNGSVRLRLSMLEDGGVVVGRNFPRES